jgi:AbrB family looped-hinge helix DNA binding protein
MKLKIDKAGRVILPKPVRDRLGLHAGSAVEVEETPEGVMLKPAPVRPSLVRREGLWVYTGEMPSGFDPVRAVKDEREDLMRKLAGL